MKLTQTGRVWALLALSTALGGMAAWAIDRHLDHKTREIERAEQGQQVTRVVAARAIEVIVYHDFYQLVEGGSRLPA